MCTKISIHFFIIIIPMILSHVPRMSYYARETIDKGGMAYTNDLGGRHQGGVVGF